MAEPRIPRPFNGKSYVEIVEDRLRGSKVPRGAADALVALDMSLFQMSRMVVKGDLVAAFLRQQGSTLEPAMLQGLAAVLRLRQGVGRPEPGLPTVGGIAEELNIDPSRASRIATALIAQGYLRRKAAQDDGRKSVLDITETGWTLLSEFLGFKWQRLVGVFEDWSEEDIVTFSRLLGRYASQISMPTGGGT